MIRLDSIPLRIRETVRCDVVDRKVRMRVELVLRGGRQTM